MTAQPALAQCASTPPDLVWRLSVEQYHAMVEANILTEDDPVELLDGWLVPKMPKSPRHRAATLLIRTALERLLPQGWYIDSQEPVTLRDSEPEPDVMVVRGQTRDYLDRHPGAGDLALVVEVSDASLERDRSVRQELYARAGIPCYWIVNLRDERVEVYTAPAAEAEPASYRRCRELGPDQHVAVQIGGADAGTVPVRELFP